MLCRPPYFSATSTATRSPATITRPPFTPLTASSRPIASVPNRFLMACPASPDPTPAVTSIRPTVPVPPQPRSFGMTTDFSSLLERLLN